MGFSRENWNRSWRLFTGALPLLALWLILPCSCLLLTLGAQSLAPIVQHTRLAIRSESLAFAGSSTSTILRISYPQRICADPLAVPLQVVSVQVAGSVGQRSSERLNISVESTDSELALVDHSGQPYPQPARWLISTSTLTSPVDFRFFLQPRATLRGQEVSLLFSVLDEAIGTRGASVASQSVPPIAVEPTWQTWMLRIVNSVSGPTSIVVTLLTALAGFGVQQWNKMSEIQREKEQQRERALEEMDALRNLLRERRFDEALRHYRELCGRQRPPWPDIQEALQGVWRKNAPVDLQRWTGLTRADLHGAAADPSPANAQRETAQPISHEEEPGKAVRATEAILWACKHLSSGRREAPGLLGRILKRKPSQLGSIVEILGKDSAGWELLYDDALISAYTEIIRSCKDLDVRERAAILVLEAPGRDSPDRQSILIPAYREIIRSCDPESGIVERAEQLLELTLRLTAQIPDWPNERLPDSSQVAAGVRALDLPLNPFGPDRAEYDPLLMEYGVRPGTFWDQVRGPRPVLVSGSSGSGRTATALLLAYDCTFPPARPREVGAFPVYLAPRFNVQGTERAQTLIDQIARSLAEALLHAIVKDPHGFLAHTRVSRTAIAHLLCRYLGNSVEEASLRLRVRGLETSGERSAILENVLQLAGEIDPGTFPRETTLLDLLGKARPTGCTCTYLLVDFQSEPALLGTVTDAARFLLERAARMARDRVYLKILVSAQVEGSLGAVPMEVVRLSWARSDLEKMLEDRLTHVGLTSLGSIYGDPADPRPDPDGRLVEAAGLSPRQLVCLGNAMLAQVKGPPLRPEHLPKQGK